MYERLIYVNSEGRAVEFASDSRLHVNIRKDVKGLFGVRTTLYTAQIVDADGEKETGYHVEPREIVITGRIKAKNHDEQDELTRELEEVFSPFQTGILRYEGSVVREIPVRPEYVPDVTDSVGDRWPTFTLELKAPDPNWRATAEKEIAAASAGTTVYYDGTKACGLEIEITANADGVDIESLTVANGGLVETVSFRTAGGVTLNTGDVILLSTSLPYVDITLNDVTALQRIDFNDTVFPVFRKGNNIVSWDAYGNEAHIAVKVRYTPLYLAL